MRDFDIIELKRAEATKARVMNSYSWKELALSGFVPQAVFLYRKQEPGMDISLAHAIVKEWKEWAEKGGYRSQLTLGEILRNQNVFTGD